MNFNYIDNNDFYVANVKVTPVEVWHGRIKIFGYRIGKFAYITDCSEIPEPELEKLYGLDLLILNSLRHAPHPTHFNLEQAVEVAQRVKAKQTYLTHITHDIIHDKTNAGLPPGIELGYDGLEINLD
jgi:phosphoribosyl 1,2-cyclic phosphate phosphodiesterase